MTPFELLRKSRTSKFLYNTVNKYFASARLAARDMTLRSAIDSSRLIDLTSIASNLDAPVGFCLTAYWTFFSKLKICKFKISPRAILLLISIIRCVAAAVS